MFAMDIWALAILAMQFANPNFYQGSNSNLHHENQNKLITLLQIRIELAVIQFN